MQLCLVTKPILSELANSEFGIASSTSVADKLTGLNVNIERLGID
jgi:hypothetical protein